MLIKLNKRNNAIDYFRGLGTIAVIYYHAILQFKPSVLDNILYTSYPLLMHNGSKEDLIDKTIVTILNGETAVIFFFILSSYYSIRSLKKAGSLKDYFLYAIGRILRIYPALCMTLLFWQLIKIAQGDPFTGADLIKNMMLYDICIHGPSWTLQVEIFLIIPAVMVSMLIDYLSKYNLQQWGGIFFFIIAVLCHDNYISLHLKTEFRLALLYLAFGLIIESMSSANCLDLIPNNRGVLFLMCCVIGALFVRTLGERNSFSAMLVQVLFLAFSIMICVYTKIITIKKRSVILLIGKLSFEIYLINVVFLQTIGVLLLDYWNGKGYNLIIGGFINGSIALVLSIPLSYLLKTYIDDKIIYKFKSFKNKSSSITTT